jgi:hypothetical protein
MSTTSGLADLLFGRTRGAILALLYGRTDQSFYTRAIAREVDASVGAVQRELENLSKVGLILRKSVGSQVFYQANRDTPIFPEMRALINKTIGILASSVQLCMTFRSKLLRRLCMDRLRGKRKQHRAMSILWLSERPLLRKCCRGCPQPRKALGAPSTRPCIQWRNSSRNLRLGIIF